MRKVITINLNNRAYQIEEDGYVALERYLATAEARLAGNPDRGEILADLEQAIADKCNGLLGPHKDVVTGTDMSQVLAQMGPVEGSSESAEAPAGPATPEAGAAPAADQPSPRAAPRRLYRLSDRKMLFGVCSGLAAYFGVDVVWVRLLFVLLGLVTGVWTLIYIAMAFIIPKALTAEEMAAAHGEPFNAQELIDRAKKKYEGYRDGSLKSPTPRRDGPESRPGYAARILGGLLLPVFTVISAALFVAALLSAAAILTHGMWWHLPGVVIAPRWFAVLIVVLLFWLVALPVKAARRASLYYVSGGKRHGWAETWSTLLWVTVTLGLIWIAVWALPGLHEMLMQWWNWHHGATTYT